jgi:integrase
LNSLSAFYSWLQNIQGYEIRNPVSPIKKFKLKLVVKTRILSKEEIASIFHSLQTKVTPNGKLLQIKETTRIILQAMFHLALYAGLRLKECKMLKREDIHFNDNVLIVAPQKTSESDPNPKSIPLNTKLKQYLLGLFQLVPNDVYVVPYIEISKREQSLSLYSHLSVKFLRSIGIKEAGLHTCRHTYISTLANSGIDSADILKYARITNLKILEVYRHITKEIHQKNIDKLDY